MKDEDWNETGVPLAYLFTFRGYGTWLHGDERGSINKFNNKYDTPYLPTNKDWHDFNRKIPKHNPVELNSKMRNSVEQGLREPAKFITGKFLPSMSEQIMFISSPPSAQVVQKKP